MARVYATAAEVWPGGAPANADRLLRAAARVIDTLLFGVVYDVDATTELPTDADVTEALSDATVSIALEAEAQGLLVPGSTRKWESVTIGSVSLSDLQGASSSDTPHVGGLPVPPDARLALSSVGRLTVVSW